FVTPTGIEIKDGLLRERDGGDVAFSLSIPATGTNNTSIIATLTNVDAANLLAALPVGDYLPQSVRDFTGQTSGILNISGLPNEAIGGIDLASSSGTVAGQSFDTFRAKATFQGTMVNLEDLQLRSAEGYITAKGTYDRATTGFDLDLIGNNVDVATLRPLLPQNESIPAIAGLTDFNAKATGVYDRPASYNINFTGLARNVVINENVLGEVTFQGNTANEILTADVTAILEGRPQVLSGTLNFGDDSLPVRIEHVLDSSPLGPFIAFVPKLRNLSITGTATGRIVFGGQLSRIVSGKRVFSTDALSGTAELSQLALSIQDSQLVATEPVSIRFSPQKVEIDRARFSGSGSNMSITGTYALVEGGENNLSIDGRVNLNLVNLFTKGSDAFFSGFANTAIRVTGPLPGRLSGTADIENGSIAAFIGSDRLTLERINGRVLFSTDQAQIQEIRGFLGGGRFVASGGALLDGFSIKEFRMDLDGDNVTVPLPNNFITTGDAVLEISGKPDPEAGNELAVTIAGRVAAKRSLYTKDIDLANIVGSRGEPSLSTGSSLNPPRFNLVIEGRDALTVRNNIADLTASVSLQLTGDANNPRLAGRITANSGSILFRNDRYQVQRGSLEFPPDTAIDPIISLQAESEISGYQIFVNLSGPLTDTELLSATVRSNPALPQADVVSLITTGNLSNTETGIPTLAQTGLNTAADILTDAIISNPARKATDKLFGLNVFEIDPIISGERLNPSARLTVGRQVNNNLRVTYSTNLSQDQNQVLALEYRLSNKLSFIAQYEHRSLSNVTRNRDNFSFEVRFRKRF
ncbi:MAG: translocation/assembly module TamB domain-containing protein, partial [Pyrinomonadaceae bacterium]